MTGKKDIHICASTTKKSVQRDEKKKTQRKLLQTLNKHFYSEICRCHVTGNVDMILQSEVDQTDKINTIISHDPQ